MKARTCPNCGYQYTYTAYYTKLLFKKTNARWKCQSCNSILGFNTSKRLITSTITFLLAVLIILFSTRLSELFKAQKDITLLITLGAFTIWALLIYSFDRFVLIKKSN